MSVLRVCPRMIVSESAKIKESIENAAPTIEPQYIDALMFLHKRLTKNHVEWAVGGELGEALRAVQVKPECIEIVTSKKGAAQIFLAVKEYAPKGVYFQIQKLDRNAVVDEKEYPVFLRSYYFEFSLGRIKVKVHGDLQFRIKDQDWSEKVSFNPEYMYVEGTKTAIVPLHIKYDIYRHLGWNDRIEKIMQAAAKRPLILKRLVAACPQLAN